MKHQIHFRIVIRKRLELQHRGVAECIPDDTGPANVVASSCASPYVGTIDLIQFKLGTLIGDQGSCIQGSIESMQENTRVKHIPEAVDRRVR